ncbi:MAG: hypothetical protein ACYTHN_22725, partial [Planctomycetota bacterium]
LVRWPRIVITKRENYGETVTPVITLDKIAFVDALSIGPTDPLPAGVTYDHAIRSSKKSWRIDFADAPFIVTENKNEPEKSIEKLHEDPDAKQAKANPEGAQYTLAGVWRGNFKSFFTGKKVPKPVQKESKGEPPPEEPEETLPLIIEKTVRSRVLMDGDTVLKEETEDAPTRIVVIGDSQVFADFILRHRHKPNVDFLINLNEWLTTEEDLSRIRSKGLLPRPLQYEKDRKTLYIILLVGGVPLLVILLGAGILAFRWIDKRAWLSALQAPPADEAAPEEPAPPSDAGTPEKESPEETQPESKETESETPPPSTGGDSERPPEEN